MKANGRKMSLKAWALITGSKTKHKLKQLRLSIKANGKTARDKELEHFTITMDAVCKVPLKEI